MSYTLAASAEGPAGSSGSRHAKNDSICRSIKRECLMMVGLSVCLFVLYRRPHTIGPMGLKFEMGAALDLK